MNSELPRAAGIGLRAPHVRHVLAERPCVPWFEVHSENYFADGGPALESLISIRANYPVSLHGVGLSLGSTDPLDPVHLFRLRRLAERIEPSSISEHLCWSSVAGRHYNDLLPLPHTEEAIAHVCARIASVQDYLEREILVENVSSYVAFSESTLAESAFVAAIAARSGCKLLLDVNNIYVNSRNHGFDAQAYLAAIEPTSVAEIHLAGFESGEASLIDTHGTPVAPEVWKLYEHALARFGPVATLIEWDTNIPEFSVLQREAATAQRRMDALNAVAA